MASTVGLIITALSAHAAPIQITQLPITITQPGTYELTAAAAANPVSNPSAPAMIFVGPTAGPVVIDLEGLTIDDRGGPIGEGIVVSAANNVTVKNGTVQNFFILIALLGSTNDTVSHITLNNLTNLNNSIGILLQNVTSPTIEDCVFNAGEFGIEDGSAGDERFIDCTFVGQASAPINFVGKPATWVLSTFHAAPN
jgi:hypothetical protein